MPVFIDLAYMLGFAWLLPFFIYKMVTRKRHRAGLLERFGWIEKSPGTRRSIWVHGVSVGEILGAVRLIQSLRERFPTYDIVLSSTTMEGHAIARKRFPDLRVVYFPMDFSFAVRRFFRALRPAIIILVELELWPNLTIYARRRKIPQIIVNGRISSRSFPRYHFFREIFGKYFRQLDLICAQDETYAERFSALGVPRSMLRVTGTMKYDNVDLSTNVAELFALVRKELRMEADERVLLGGSTHESEEAMLAATYVELRDSFPDLRLVLAPRHIQRVDAVTAACRAHGLEPVLLTAFRSNGALLDRDTVLVVDTVGDLRRLYAGANLVFVGGSLIPHGGHNMIEPAGLGKPVVIGPHTFNFANDVSRLMHVGALTVVENQEQLTRRTRGLLEQPEEARRRGERGRRMIEAHVGATRRNLAGITQILQGSNPAPARMGAR